MKHLITHAGEGESFINNTSVGLSFFYIGLEEKPSNKLLNMCDACLGLTKELIE